MKHFRVIGKYESSGELVSLVVPAEDERGARDRAEAEGISITEVHLSDGTPNRSTSPTLHRIGNILLFIGFLGASFSCIASVALAIHAFASVGPAAIAYFPVGFLMSAATAVLFWRVLDLTTRGDYS